MLAILPSILVYLLGSLSYSIYVNTSGKDNIKCGSIATPCRSLSFTINNASSHNDNIFLIASPFKQISYTLENSIVIKHSLTVSKFPVYSHNPLITYDCNVTNNRKDFYAFSIFPNTLAPDILNLNIKSVNFNVNILTTLTGEISGFHLSFSISDSIISSPSHAVNFSDVSGYQNISIQMKNLVIQNGAFKFKNIRERCEPMKDIKNIIKMNNITIRNTENIALSVHGCFNVSIENLMCSNITSKKQNLFTFTGSVLNAKNVLIKNVLTNDNAKNNKFDLKALLLIYKSVGEIQNILIKDSGGRRFSAVLIAQNTAVKLQNMEMEGNSFSHFLQADKSSICVENMTLSENNFIATLYRVKESNVTLYEIKFYRNKIGCLLYINRNSKVLITNNSLTSNEIFKNAYLVLRSRMILNNTNFHRNKIDTFMVAKSQSHISIDNLVLTNSSGNKQFASYSKFDQKVSADEILILMTMYIWMIMGYDFSSTVCDLSGNSTIQLNNVAFVQNKLSTLLRIKSKSRAIMQNSTLTENSFLWIYYSKDNSIIQLNNVVFARNCVRLELLWIKSNCSAIIQNKTMVENALNTIYKIEENSKIQLNHVTFISNRLNGTLLRINSKSSAIIQNNILTENDASYTVYDIGKNSTIQLNHVIYIRNRLIGTLLRIHSKSSAIVQNSKLTDNNISVILYYISGSCNIKLINNTMVGNSLNQMFVARSSYLEIDTIFIENNTLSELISAFECNVSFDSMKIKKNGVTSSIVHVQNSAGRVANTYIESYNNIMISAFMITCTYLGNKCFPFEIANTEIRWEHALPVSALPIIYLSGNVSLVNVKLLVTSVFDTEILRYSIKDLPLSVNENPKIFSNINIISSLLIRCTKARVKHIVKTGTFHCIPCARGTYTLENESLNTSLSFQSKNVILREDTNFTCLDCPVGAICAASIKSRSNFYGYETNDQKLKFLPCPKGFCCTGSQCNDIQSCNKNRIGTLCGRCIESYVESFLTTGCISIHSCQNFAKFWLLYCTYALLLATFLYYMKDSITLIKTAVSNFGRIFKSCTKGKENDVDTDTMISINGTEEPQEKISHFTMSGIFTLIVSFYQIRQLISVDVQSKNSTDFSFITFITDCLNLEMVVVTYSSYCPISDLNAVSKLFIKTYLLTATLLIATLLNYFISGVLHFFRPRLGRLSSLKPSDRLGVCLIRVLMFSYKNMASASLLLLNCVEVEDVKVLFIKGDTKCYQWWQIVIAVFFFTWILFFPLSLKVSFSMFMKDEISFVKFILCLMVPFAVVVNYRINRNVASFDLKQTKNTYKVKEILSEIFQESYRLKTDDPSDETVFYESWRLYQRVFLAIVATFCVDPLKRITLMTPIVLLIAISYFVIKPYKPEMYILHWMEVSSILGIFVCLIHNMFRGFLYAYDIKFEDPITFVLQGFTILDMISSPICVVIYFFIIKTIYRKAKCKVKSIYYTLRRYYGGSVLLHKK